MPYHQNMENEKTEDTRVIPHSEIVAMMSHLNMELSLKSPEDKAKYLVDITNKFHKMYSKLKSTENASGSPSND